MSSIGLPPSLNAARIDTYTRLDGADTVHVQAMIPANPFTATTGTLAAAAQTVTVANLVDADGVLVTTSGTFSGTLAFEASVNGTDWYAIIMSRASTGTGESTRALTGTTLEGWRANIAGWPQFRVRCSAYTSGTASIRIIPVSLAFEPPMNASVTAAVSGTVTANIGTGSLAAGTNAIGDVGLQARANATGAMSTAKVLAAATTNATSVKATAGRVLGWQLTNTTAAVKVVRLYNLATAPTVGTSVPVYNIVIPANGHVSESFPVGIAHATGIAYAITNAIADLDATAVAANDVLGAIYFA